MKLCINCKHHVVDPDVPKSKYARCGYNRPVSLVDGQPVPVNDLSFCSSQRIGFISKLNCGTEGQFFEEATNV